MRRGELIFALGAAAIVGLFLCLYFALVRPGSVVAQEQEPAPGPPALKCTGFKVDLRPAAGGAGILHVDETTISEAAFRDVRCKDSAAVRVTLAGKEHVIVRWDGRVEIYE